MENNPSKPLPGIAVIGSGYWGKNLVRNFYNIGALKLICDKDDALLNGFRKQYEQLDLCFAVSEVLNRDDIKGVAIATPAETHYRIAREAILAGKHVFVEKPLALHEWEGHDLNELANRHKRILMVGHLLHYHPVFHKLKELAMEGELGRINYIYSNRLNLGKIRREENILWSFAPHDISMILSLADEEPEYILSTGGNYLHRKIADVTTTHFEFPSGLKAHIFVSWLHPYKEQKLVVVGDRKMAVFDDTQKWKNKLLLFSHKIQWHHNIPTPSKAEPERFEIAQDEPLSLECRHFLDCISSGKKPITDAEEGLKVLRVLNASQISLDRQGDKIALTSETFVSSSTVGAKATVESSSAIDTSAFIHETVKIDSDCQIGGNSKIWHFSHVLSNSKIGDYCNIGQNVVIGPDVVIGARCKIQNNVSVYKGVTLEEGVFCGPSMVFTNILNPRAEISKMDQIRPTLVKRGTTIGANATIICGVTLGTYSFVGAGSVVTHNVPDYGLVIGNPAKRIGWMCACGERLGEDLECVECGKTYVESQTGLVPENDQLLAG